MQVLTITHPHAKAAIYAACHRNQWGREAALRYIQRLGVPVSLYRLACQLQVANKLT